MLPLAFEAAVGLDIGTVAELAGEAKTLREMWEIASGAKTAQGLYSRFAGMVRRGQPGVAAEVVRTVYRAARYYADQGKYLAQYDKDVIMDRRLAQVVESTTGLAPGGKPIRFGVDVSVTYASTGETRIFPVWIESDEFRSPEDAIDRAIAQIMGQFKPRSRFESYGGEAPDGWVTGTVTNFERFVKVGVA